MLGFAEMNKTTIYFKGKSAENSPENSLLFQSCPLFQGIKLLCAFLWRINYRHNQINYVHPGKFSHQQLAPMVQTGMSTGAWLSSKTNGAIWLAFTASSSPGGSESELLHHLKEGNQGGREDEDISFGTEAAIQFGRIVLPRESVADSWPLPLGDSFTQVIFQSNLLLFLLWFGLVGSLFLLAMWTASSQPWKTWIMHWTPSPPRTLFLHESTSSLELWGKLTCMFCYHQRLRWLQHVTLPSLWWV